MARAIDAGAVKRRAWDIAEAWKDQGRDYEALLLESVVEQIVDTQPTLTPPNEPLTLEELREMNEVPVWIQNLEEPAKSQWRLLYWDRGKYLVLQGISVRGYLMEEYGESWLAYRRPPEGEENA